MGLIHGLDSDNYQRVLLMDSSGRPLVVLGPSTSNIGDVDVLTTPNAVNKYSSLYSFYGGNTNLSAGTNTFYSTAIAAGYGAIIQHIDIVYTGTVAGVIIKVGKYSGGGTYALYMLTNLTSALEYDKVLNVALNTGDSIKVVVTGATAGDDCLIYIHGYNFPIA